MAKDFKALTYIVDENLADTLHWLSLHQDCFDAFHYDVLSEELSVEHANGVDIIRVGHYLNAEYGILLTS
ncbi:hypothetical protein [Acinetobacter rudis]|uniref:Uncharacterized protein n=1 Tax=Acinetobacter rudis CIP 110305 TaxID=421052 RepID=S3NZ59_9GAMM|nr:hypothetical protein [Acinetobacter rudis]EPF71896.1 hypothetical protein F945_02242 [Acinetobacter rudis CIP 110305]